MDFETQHLVICPSYGLLEKKLFMRKEGTVKAGNGLPVASGDYHLCVSSSLEHLLCARLGGEG